MLNALKLSELLNKNTNPQLYPRIFIMSPSGTLLAYNTPIDIRSLRDQAALLSLTWKDHALKTPHLQTLTVETPNSNIIARAIQPSLLLVLVGAVPPVRGREELFRITAEGEGEARYPPAIEEEGGRAHGKGEGKVDVGSGKAASVLSSMSSRERDLKAGVLHVQRKKVDALTEYLRADFDAKGFVMPDDSSFS